MAVAPGSIGSNVIRNPFMNSKVDGPTFNDPAKRSPTDNISGSNITNLEQNRNFTPSQGEEPNITKPKPSSDDPMEGLDTLWDDPVIDDKNKSPEFKGYLPEIDPVKFNENVGKIDFSKSINPETMKKILAGGEEAAAAYPDLINSIGRQAFSMAFNASTKMTKASLDNVEKRFMDDLIPNSIQNRIVDDTMNETNELARNPKYKPMFDRVKTQLATKYPKASAQQIAKATQTYMEGYIKDATSKNQVEDDNTAKLKKGSGEADWEAWLNP